MQMVFSGQKNTGSTIPRLFSCPENVVCFFTSAAYIQVHFRLDFFREAHNISMNPDLFAI